MNNTTKTVLIIVIVLVVAGGAYLIWKNNKHVSTPEQTQSFFYIPEANLRVPTPSDINGLQYSIKNSPGSTLVYFSSTDLMNAAANASSSSCQPSDGPLGALAVVNKPVPTGGPQLPENARDFGSFVAYFSGPQATCSSDKTVQDIQTRQIHDLQTAMDSLQTFTGDRGASYQPVSSTMQTYTNSTYGFEFQYPQGFGFVTPAYANLQDKVTQLNLDSSGYPNTNFNDAAFAVSASFAKSLADCLSQNPPPNGDGFKTGVTIGGKQFYKTQSSDAAAGNRYDSTIYRTLSGTQTCIELNETIHTGAIGNYPTGTSEVDKTAIQSLLDSILNTFKFNS